MSDLDSRALAFLRESNALEEITNIDYCLPELAEGEDGHVGAFRRSQELAGWQPPPNEALFAGGPEGEAELTRMRAAHHQPLTVEALCTWQRLVAEEQLRFGHPIPRAGVGRMRGPEAPVDVYVGSHVAPSHGLVRELTERWLGELNQRLSEVRRYFASDVALAETLGEFFQRFEAIHPFVDGNGRVGRLVANYIVTAFGAPIFVFRASERPAFYAAHRSKAAMNVFMADKLREAIWSRDGSLVERSADGSLADIYAQGEKSLIVERHELLAARERWLEKADCYDQLH